MISGDSGSEQPTVQGLAARYSPRLPAFDEMMGADGRLRPHWQTLADTLDLLGPEEMRSRWEHGRRLIRENGVTHNVYGDGQGMARPWALDLIPLPIPAGQWQIIGDALVQRARLLNSLLNDLYGRGTCLTQGLVPPELVYSHPGFLRPVHGQFPPDHQWLYLYAADLIHCRDGQYRVLADRTQAPSGAGYSLENRIVLNRVLPGAFRQCNVLRLAPFFITLRQTLAAVASANRDNPRVVLLTPGPYNETYFEHAFLARYLGYTLVQGNDLTVRSGRVYLKTLTGLHTVDAILRRVDDDFCDPLELNSRSFLGVPGLLQAVRDGNVTVANAIGSGLAQAPALHPFLPAICRHLLGEELKMPSVATWWCGQPEALRYVLENLPNLVIKRAFSAGSSNPVFGQDLSAAALAELKERIAARPMQFVAQERLESFAAPALIDEHLESRRLLVRAFLAASGDSYTVMPGGLTRVTPSAESMVVSLQKGGGSKDTWILGQGPVTQVTLLPPTSMPVALSRGGSDLPSRVADDLYWLGRYVQRADAQVRLARFVLGRLSEESTIESPRTIELLGRQLMGRPPRPGPGAARRLAADLLAPTDPSGLRSAIGRVHRLARVLRDRISTDAWRIVSDIDTRLNGSATTLDDEMTGVVEWLNGLVGGFLAFCGMAAESMTRGQAWQFVDLGMRIEHGQAATRLIGKSLAATSTEEPFLLDALLEIADSSLTYRRRYLTHLEVPAVVDLLLADGGNPRAVAFQVAAIDRHLAELPGESGQPSPGPGHSIATELRARLASVDIHEECRIEEGRRDRLVTLTTDIDRKLSAISDQISQTYFSHATAPVPLDATDGPTAEPAEEGVSA
jgi:uncharacterized circularly permuted ATP-grasp superfamily protein/uncharacterized alpha-E superfamily protein